jgi:hypothetical protein
LSAGGGGQSAPAGRCKSVQRGWDQRAAAGAVLVRHVAAPAGLCGVPQECAEQRQPRYTTHAETTVTDNYRAYIEHSYSTQQLFRFCFRFRLSFIIIWYIVFFFFALFSTSDDALRMCTNVSSADVVNHITLCRRLLPRIWGKDDVSALCEGGTSR